MDRALQTTLLWAKGLVAATISGGAGAVTATMTASIVAPDKFNVGNQLHNFLALAGATFAINGFMGAAAYLKQSPVPPDQTQTK